MTDIYSLVGDSFAPAASFAALCAARCALGAIDVADDPTKHGQLGNKSEKDL